MYLKKLNIAVKKSKLDQGEFLGKSLCVSMNAKKLGHGHLKKISFFTFPVQTSYIKSFTSSSSGGPCVLVQETALSSSCQNLCFK